MRDRNAVRSVLRYRNSQPEFINKTCTLITTQESASLTSFAVKSVQLTWTKTSLDHYNLSAILKACTNYQLGSFFQKLLFKSQLLDSFCARSICMRSWCCVLNHWLLLYMFLWHCSLCHLLSLTETITTSNRFVHFLQLTSPSSPFILRRVLITAMMPSHVDLIYNVSLKPLS